VDDLKYLEEHPFKYADEHMDVVMEVCPTCQVLQQPHVKVCMRFGKDDREPAHIEYDTVTHGLEGLLRAALTLVAGGQPGAWDYVYSIAAWHMMLPGTPMLETPPKSRAH
jgi:hypothetical protein